jgi:alpha-L-fucosidase
MHHYPRWIVFALLTLILGSHGVGAECTADPYGHETEEERDARMAWWREARFGMFIHWGVYAVPAGTYDGKRIDGIGEWIMLRGRIPVAEYRAYASDFNPVRYDPDAWARLAKEAGMKYVVITSKHHDGFALFDSKVTDWDVVDATPYGKDLLMPLVEACHRHGLKIGFYYSQAQDWTHPGGAKAGYEEGEGWDEAHRGDFDRYLADIAYPQVQELLRGYPIDVLWWDTPRWMNKARAERLLPLVALRPGLITNNRLGGGFAGDTDTPEQRIPATGIAGRDWETCMTMNRTWGYKSYDHDWKSTETLVRNLIDIASKGGNYLLNVGPTKEGLIPQPSIHRLREVGQWMKANGEAIYGTSASPFAGLTWGRCTTKTEEVGTTLYLHVFDWPSTGELLLPGLHSKVAHARLLVGGQALPAEASEDGVVLQVPAGAADPIATVIRVDLEEPLRVEKVLPRPGPDGTLKLSAEAADLEDPPGGGEAARVETKGGEPNIGFWFDARSQVAWTFQLKEAGTYTAEAVVANPSKGNAVVVAVGEQQHQMFAPQTGSYATFQPVEVGRFVFKEPGTYTLSVKPLGEGWKPVNLRSITLRPTGG